MAGTSKTRGSSGPVALLDAPVPPHSVEAEQAVLGGLLIDPGAWDNVADAVVAQDFYRHDHELIFSAIAALTADAKPCDVVTVSQFLERTGQLEHAGGLAYLSSIARDTPTAANVRSYADIVRERSLLRQLIRAGTDIASAVYVNDGQSARDLVDRAEQKVFEIAEGTFRKRDGAVAVRTLLPAVIDQIDEAHNNPNKLRGLATGFTEFDKLTGGLRPGDLVIVAGRPSMGKTTLAVNMAEYAAVNPNSRASVAIFSMEMPSEQVITRMLASIGGVPLNSLRSGRITDDDWVRITGATSQLSEAKIFIDETPALNPTEIRARARRVKREHGLDLVVVDYLQLMQVPGTKENRATEIAEISRGLKALAKELQVPVIALSQLNRGVEQREHKKPVMSDLRECVTGDTLVCLTDGSRVPIAELVGQTPEGVGGRRAATAGQGQVRQGLEGRTPPDLSRCAGERPLDPRDLQASGPDRVGLDDRRHACPGRSPGACASTAGAGEARELARARLVLLGHLLVMAAILFTSRCAIPRLRGKQRGGARGRRGVRKHGQSP